MKKWREVEPEGRGPAAVGEGAAAELGLVVPQSDVLVVKALAEDGGRRGGAARGGRGGGRLLALGHLCLQINGPQLVRPDVHSSAGELLGSEKIHCALSHVCVQEKFTDDRKKERDLGLDGLRPGRTGLLCWRLGPGLG